MVEVLAALANPHRLRMLGLLQSGRNYVSQIAREVGLSRPLVHMHLQKLEAAGLIEGALEMSDDGKAMKYFDVTPFSIRLTPRSVAAIAETITAEEELH
jgi:ArsR family transcriptional regulator